MSYLNPETTAEISDALRRNLEFNIGRAVKEDEIRRLNAEWEADRDRRLAVGVTGHTPDDLASSVVGLLCDDPDVWLTNGRPSDGKLDRIKQRIVEAIKAAEEREAAGRRAKEDGR